jgi:alcohol dehydrogenase class IV
MKSFRWHDGERMIVFGRGSVDAAADLLGTGYSLLTTPRAAPAARDVVDRAQNVHFVDPGRVDELAAGLLSVVGSELIVALGGGRVIDVAKALAAASPGRRVAAIPTTLSGAEMTAVHRQAAGAKPGPGVRPAIVINDPALSASQPLPELAASAANALGHAVEGPLTALSNPVAALAAGEAVRLLGEVDDPEAIALGALLAGYVIGSTWYGLHHVLSQTLVRFAGIGHGPANAIMLPHSITALARRGYDGEAEALAVRLAELTGATRLRDVGVAPADLDRCADEAASRPELAMTPPPADRDEIRALYQSAY